MHPEQHTELDNLITMQHNLRTSAKGSNDAYDVSVSLTDCDDPVNQDLLLRQYGERIEMLSQQDKLSKFCLGRAGHTVTGTGRHLDAKSTTRQINFKEGVKRQSMKTFTIDLSVTSSSGRR